MLVADERKASWMDLPEEIQITIMVKTFDWTDGDFLTAMRLILASNYNKYMALKQGLPFVSMLIERAHQGTIKIR